MGVTAFIIMEIGIPDKTINTKQKYITLIGDRLFLRQAFDKTNAIVSNNNGYLDFHSDGEGVTIGVMMEI